MAIVNHNIAATYPVIPKNRGIRKYADFLHKSTSNKLESISTIEIKNSIYIYILFLS